jgi:hypothetical protein
MRNITEIQRRLIALGYLNANGDDGRFGHMSLDAYNRFRATIGKGPVVQANMAELNADLFPEEHPAPKTPTLNKPNLFDALGAILSLGSLLKGKTMNWNDVQQIARIVAYAAAGWLGAKGGLDPANVETLGGAILGIVSVAWWFFWNRKVVK